MPDLPAGTVTFLFTDIEGSTRLLEELGASYVDVVEDHHAAVRSALSHHGGVEVDTQGDAFFAAFPSAHDAVAAAQDIQRALADGPVRVRIGIHTGEAQLSSGGYVGMDVHRAARICAAAHGGQIIISQSTHALVDTPTRDLGEYRLKDLSATQRLFQVVVAGLRDTFPPPRTLDRVRTNLPVQTSPIVGRERELRETSELLRRDSVRLLTLTGPGGGGKTRLAIELAARVLEGYDDGVFLVDLAGLRDPTLVLATTAQAVGLGDTRDRPVADALAEFLGGKRTLLIMDNFEHVLESAPDVGRLLATCRGVDVVATSRSALRLTGEQEYPVPPLPGEDAVELFVERARAVRPAFGLDGNRGAVADICARLDGLPLAIELAAARIKVVPPQTLLERLDQRFTVLTGGARDAPERHQALRATMDWSFELLSDIEQELFARLSVFAGRFTLEAAETVCDASIDALASLVDNSLVGERQNPDGEPAFALLETLREYGRERLAERGDADAIAQRHAEYVLAIAEAIRAADRENAPDSAERQARFHGGIENVRAAMAWFRDAGDVERELRLATASFWNVWRISVTPEIYGWLIAALERSESVDRSVRTGAYGALALAAVFVGENAASRRFAEATLALAQEAGDERQTEWALRALSFTEEDPEERWRLLRECERLVKSLGDDEALGWVKQQLGWALFDEARFDEARGEFEGAADVFRRAGRPWEATNAELSTGAALVAGGREDLALPLLQGVVREAGELGAPRMAADCFQFLAAARVKHDARWAARLLAAAAFIYEEEGLPFDETQRKFSEEAATRARRSLGDDFDVEWAAGRALDFEAAVALALDAR